MSELICKCKKAKEAAQGMVKINTKTKNDALDCIAKALSERADEIIAANKIDIEAAKANGIRDAMIDRLTLTPERIEGIARGVKQVKELNDPIGEVINTVTPKRLGNR